MEFVGLPVPLQQKNKDGQIDYFCSILEYCGDVGVPHDAAVLLKDADGAKVRRTTHRKTQLWCGFTSGTIAIFENDEVIFLAFYNNSLDLHY
jgi:hypothetical protein